MAEEGGRAGGQGEAGGLWRRYPINPCCHIRGHWMYVDIPSDLSSSTIKMLMRDDDKCLRSAVIRVTSTDRRRLVVWSIRRSKCASVWTFGTPSYTIRTDLTLASIDSSVHVQLYMHAIFKCTERCAFVPTLTLHSVSYNSVDF